MQERDVISDFQKRIKDAYDEYLFNFGAIPEASNSSEDEQTDGSIIFIAKENAEKYRRSFISLLKIVANSFIVIPNAMCTIDDTSVALNIFVKSQGHHRFLIRRFGLRLFVETSSYDGLSGDIKRLEWSGPHFTSEQAVIDHIVDVLRKPIGSPSHMRVEAENTLLVDHLILFAEKVARLAAKHVLFGS